MAHSKNSCMSTTVIYEAFQYYRDEVTLVYYLTVFHRNLCPSTHRPLYPAERPASRRTLLPW